MEAVGVAVAPTRLGTLIRERRRRARLTQLELATAINTTRENIAQIETGRIQEPSRDIVNALARALPVSVLELVAAIGYDIKHDPALMLIGDERDDALRLLDALRSKLTRQGPDDRPGPSAARDSR